MFSWDARKARANLKKHGVSFEEAATVFADPNGLDYDDIEHSESELRSVESVSPLSAGSFLFIPDE